ncbi:sugar nucleotide-binding protein [Methylotuvimicrobium sp.]|uniref:sugar nucleotide-binding protein n=1 Tax=Methylotuvimicrobium sp. TaxID=2822413 RepID=UPI003D65EAE1
MMTKLLIAGYGDIGARLASILDRKHYQVFGLKRNPPLSDAGGTRFLKADLTRPEDLERLDCDFDQVLYLPTPGGRDAEAYRAVFDTALNNLIQRFKADGRMPQWFFVSSTGVYGQTAGEWVDESSDAQPNSVTGQIIRKAEQTLLEHDSSAVVVRFSGIYGPGRERLLHMASRQAAIQADPPYYTNRIHQDDCAAVLAFLMKKHIEGERLDNLYLASDDNPAPMWDVISWLAQQMNSQPPIAKPADNVPDQNKRCRNSRLKTLGFRFKYPTYREGYGEMFNLG